MKCDRCQASIAEGEVRTHLGQNLCEDCYMDALSPARTCDPWTVHSARTFEAQSGNASLTPLQSEILDILEDTGGIEPAALLKRIAGPATMRALEREFATLRHMEKARAEKRGDRVVWRLW